VVHTLNPKSLAIFHKQLNSIAKLQHNQYFQSSLYLLKRVISKQYNEGLAFAQAIGRSTPLCGDVMLFLAIDKVVNSDD
jgi:hypothetical protein